MMQARLPSSERPSALGIYWVMRSSAAVRGVCGMRFLRSAATGGALHNLRRSVRTASPSHLTSGDVASLE